MPVVPFLPAIIGAGGSIASSLIGRSASKGAADDQIAAQNRIADIATAGVNESQGYLSGHAGEANKVISDSVQSQLEMFRPYIEAGGSSLRSLEDLTKAGGELDTKFSFGRENLDNDPGFQFVLDEGKKAIEQSSALRGGLFSTGTVKNLANYQMGAANQYFNDAYQRGMQAFNTNRASALSRVSSLQDLARLGIGGTTAAGGATQRGASEIAGNIFNTGRGMADIEMRGTGILAGVEDNKGDSLASGRIGSANATARGVAGATDAVTKSISDWLAKRGASSGGGGYPGAGGGTTFIDNDSGFFN
jgi:hypothetical protein